MKIIVACGNGLGTSMIIKIKVENVCRKLLINADIKAISIGEAKTKTEIADIILCSSHLVNQFKQNNRAKIIGVVNIMDENEIEKALVEIIK